MGKNEDFDPYEENHGAAPFSEPEAQIMRKALFMPYDHKNTTPSGLESQKRKLMLETLKHVHSRDRCVVGSGSGYIGSSSYLARFWVDPEKDEIHFQRYGASIKRLLLSKPKGVDALLIMYATDSVVAAIAHGAENRGILGWDFRSVNVCENNRRDILDSDNDYTEVLLAGVTPVAGTRVNAHANDIPAVNIRGGSIPVGSHVSGNRTQSPVKRQVSYNVHIFTAAIEHEEKRHVENYTHGQLMEKS
ncbi:Peptidase M14, carboxypeptidase A [Artemisia annua]|uniref:Peptidase M14, carboxypeptidase A n=1 Tax=Artemisia annua TaxID=35608 RepID=A0A2U1PUI0_ARTAN|nr:Peptidase M14, carboxypeptidase A [Artemisia annua]